MSRYSPKLLEPADIRVVIRNSHGHFLSQDENGLYFTPDRSQAMLFDYRADQIPQQLETIEKERGVKLFADPVPPEEIYEACDRCKELFPPFMIFFDGKRFLCADCRKMSQARSTRPANTSTAPRHSTRQSNWAGLQ